MNQKSKNEKRRIILDYVAKIHKKENRFVSKREIRRIFHLELYNYFKNVFDMYQKIGIEVPICYHPRDQAIKKILEFVKEKSNKGMFPFYRELEQELGIHMRTYFKNIREVYEKANIDYSLYEKRKHEVIYKIYSEKENQIKRNLIIKFIQEKTKKGFYPGAQQIQKELNLAFYKYFNNIQEAYKKANTDYQRISPITLGKDKEELLTKIVILLLKNMNYKVKRVSIHDKKLLNRGEDIRVIDDKKNVVLIELKAYRKDYNIIKREINQLHNYLVQQRIKKGILITTSNKVNFKIPNVKIIDGFKLISLLKKHNLHEYINKVRWIQEERVNLLERINFIESKRKEIIYFIINHKDTPSKKEIEKNLCLDMRSYFKTNCFKQLIKEIKNKSNNGSAQLCMDHQQKLQYT